MNTLVERCPHGIEPMRSLLDQLIEPSANFSPEFPFSSLIIEETLKVLSIGLAVPYQYAQSLPSHLSVTKSELPSTSADI
jgi:hypothetical protein